MEGGHAAVLLLLLSMPPALGSPRELSMSRAATVAPPTLPGLALLGIGIRCTGGASWAEPRQVSGAFCLATLRPCLFLGI
jgi:hypothetical protein